MRLPRLRSFTWASPSAESPMFWSSRGKTRLSSRWLTSAPPPPWSPTSQRAWRNSAAAPSTFSFPITRNSKRTRRTAMRLVILPSLHAPLLLLLLLRVLQLRPHSRQPRP
uniref:Uncharacterized protein n=1 Tax=Cacopsylla melanoneura TaxID=428564 RepID=A0A8D8X1X3_9HEMI